MAKFKKGDIVWIEYPNHQTNVTRIRRAIVVALVRKRQLPNTKKFPMSKQPTGMGRDHISYVVESGGKNFWPLVKYIQAA